MLISSYYLFDHFEKRINSFFTPNTGMVIGFSPTTPTKWWLSKFQSIDAILADLIAWGSLGWGHAVACTGRNLSLIHI